jgi:uncharacterized protein YjbI with pentapeptide repeats
VADFPPVSSLWQAYLDNREQVAPLLAPAASFLGTLATLAVGVFLALAALRQAKTATRVAEIAAQQAATAMERHKEQTEADRQRRITETFTKAVEQLGNDKLQVRLGGVYVLERVLRESDQDYWPVLETLASFVRERVRLQLDPLEAGPSLETEYPPKALRGPPADVEAVLNVLRRRGQTARERDEGWQIDLSNCDLQGANLRGINLQAGVLSGTDLTWAYLVGADLKGAFLPKANLSRARAEGVNFAGAVLRGATLPGADLYRATLRGADLTDARLDGADLRAAQLERAELGGAILTGADLREAQLLLANFDKANIAGANLKEVIGLRSIQMEAAIGDAATRLPEATMRPAHWTG